mgnify:CR=1 FL=1
MGSSPLARGLHGIPVDQAQAYGIIPARAGFTRSALRRGMDGQDHPRSRGVYDVRECCHCTVAGSSPLARGLLSGEPTVGEPTRIIPARAGFT